MCERNSLTRNSKGDLCQISCLQAGDSLKTSSHQEGELTPMGDNVLFIIKAVLYRMLLKTQDLKRS